MNLTLKNLKRVSLERITVSGKKKSLIQYICAGDSDEAYSAALNTFDARINGMDDTCCLVKGYQPACKHSRIGTTLRFGYQSSWVTIDDKNLTIFEAWELASKRAQEYSKDKFNGFTEIYSV